MQLHAAYSGSVNMQGYLLKHRPVRQLMGLFAQEWELRWGAGGTCFTPCVWAQTLTNSVTQQQLCLQSSQPVDSLQQSTAPGPLRPLALSGSPRQTIAPSLDFLMPPHSCLLPRICTAQVLCVDRHCAEVLQE